MASRVAFQLYRFIAQCALPLYRVWTRVRGSHSQLAGRFGEGAWSSIYQKHRGAIWVHCASVGEVRGILPLLKVLSASCDVVGSTTSLTGRAEFLSHLDAVELLPFDAPSLLEAHLEAFAPSVLVINETEIWPCLFAAAHKRAIPICIVNARISDRSFPRYRALRGLFATLLAECSVILAQTTRDAQRFLALGAEPQCVHVTGSTKYDVEVSPLSEHDRSERRVMLGLHPTAPCLIAGSVRPGEFEQVLAAYVQAKQQCSELQLIIAPRHPEYFEAVASELATLGISFTRISEQAQNQQAPVVLVDTLGQLRSLYGLADVAFIGATLVPIGGHNPLEASAEGLPVIVGPHVANIREVVAQLVSEEAAMVVEDSSSLSDAVLGYCLNSATRERASAAAQAVARSHQGAVGRVEKQVLSLCNGRGQSARRFGSCSRG